VAGGCSAHLLPADVATGRRQANAAANANRADVVTSRISAEPNNMSLIWFIFFVIIGITLGLHVFSRYFPLGVQDVALLIY